MNSEHEEVASPPPGAVADGVPFNDNQLHRNRSEHELVEDNEDKHDGEEGSEVGDEDEDGDEDEQSEDEPVEPLALGRQRRSNAGNRMAAVIAAEDDLAGEDEVNMLFAEDGEEPDVEFDDNEADEGADEEDDDSSTDEEDHGPAAGADDLEGEAELKKQERVQKQGQKRKSIKQFARPFAVRKKVKIEMPAMDDDKTIEKAERVKKRRKQSDGPVRTSSRTLSVQNKERTLERVQESETKRQQQTGPSQRGRRAHVQREMTLEERLAEAAETEEKNRKSLHTWEVMEQERQAKSRARLAAMQNRKLEGPVIRWRSRQALWFDGKIKHLIGKVVEDVEEEDVESNEMEVDEHVQDTIVVSASHTNETGTAVDASLDNPEALAHLQEGETIDHEPPADPALQIENAAETKEDMADFLDGIDYYAALSEGQKPSTAAPKNASENDQSQIDAAALEDGKKDGKKDTTNSEQDKPVEEMSQQAIATTAQPETQPERSNPSSSPSPDSTSPGRTAEPPETQSAKKEETLATANLISLINVNPVALNDLDVSRRILFRWSHTRAAPSIHPSPYSATRAPTTRPSSLCVITQKPAQYRDPKSGLPYADLAAYRMINRLVASGCQWSITSGCWMGIDGTRDGGLAVAARGVPPGFEKGNGDRLPSVKQETADVQT